MPFSRGRAAARPAFKEEREWRLAFTGFTEEPIYHYRVSRGMLAPYVKYEMPSVAADLCPISHVVIGPKNPTPPAPVYAILRKYGHFGNEVIRSNYVGQSWTNY